MVFSSAPLVSGYCTHVHVPVHYSACVSIHQRVLELTLDEAVYLGLVAAVEVSCQLLQVYI